MSYLCKNIEGLFLQVFFFSYMYMVWYYVLVRFFVICVHHGSF